MYKYIRKEITGKLTEVQQSSPVRYKVLLEGKETLTEATQWFKCTDYLNDFVVATQCKVFFVVYGMKNEVIKGDLFLAIKDYGKTFEENLGYINRWLDINYGHKEPITFWEEDVDDIPKGVRILRIPKYYITNTVYISLVMLLIRRCTYGDVVDYENLFMIDSKADVISRNAAFNPWFHKLIDPKNKPALDKRVLTFLKTEYVPEKYEYIRHVAKKEDFNELHKHDLHNAGILSTMCVVRETPELQKELV